MMEGRGQRVVIADGDRTVLEVLQIRLEVAGYHAQIARSSVAVLDILKHGRPAAMILDAALPGMDGFELLRTIRMRQDQHFPILMTGRNMTADDVKRALGYGAQSFMVKPYGGTEAVERIGRLLQAPKPAPVLQPRPVAYI